MENMNRKKVVLFGTGKIYSIFLQICNSEELDIIGVCDNAKSKQGKILEGMQVNAPERLLELDYDFVIITTAYFQEVTVQLLQMGIEKDRILNFYNIYKRLQPIADDNWHGIIKEDVINALYTQYDASRENIEQKNLEIKNLFINARKFARDMRDIKINSLEEVEFQVFSQFGEDGIIQWLINNVEIPNKTFVEFGVEDYTESNTRFLLMNNNWSGLVIDGSEENVRKIKNGDLFWKYDLTAIAQFITKDNINWIITESGFEGDIGILSVDIDGNDYWVLNAINCVKPRILICEYNNIFGGKELVTIPYKEDFYRTDSHYSNLYWGASLGAFKDWADKNGYYYFGSNSAGNNAFFVRKDSVSKDLIPIKSEEFVCSKYRESRDRNGKFTFLRGKECIEAIKDMQLINLTTGNIEKIADIYYL